jgi:hypothetical protein
MNLPILPETPKTPCKNCCGGSCKKQTPAKAK